MERKKWIDIAAYGMVILLIILYVVYKSVCVALWEFGGCKF